MLGIGVSGPVQGYARFASTTIEKQIYDVRFDLLLFLEALLFLPKIAMFSLNIFY
jgi:hypothetical protein